MLFLYWLVSKHLNLVLSTPKPRPNKCPTLRTSKKYSNFFPIHTVRGSSFSKQSQPHVLKIVAGGWAHGHSSGSRFYFTGAIEQMSEILDDYQLRVDAGVP